MKTLTTDLPPPANLAARRAEAFPDPEKYFQQRLEQIVHTGDWILDAGCGAGKFFSLDFATAAGCRLFGVDIQENLNDNPRMDFRARADLKRLPFSDGTFDVVNCRLVIEHLDAPEIVLREFFRVLRSGGRLAVLTPNLLHYFGAAASLTPDWFHVWFNTRVRGFESTDIFPTYYRANTRRKLRALLSQSGFDQVEITMVEGAPNVLAFNRVLHRLGIAYERLVKRFEVLSALRLNIIAVAHKA
jgi:ubiquinone/menaquinone biosynthesis C-methylase UbiE